MNASPSGHWGAAPCTVQAAMRSGPAAPKPAACSRRDDVHAPVPRSGSTVEPAAFTRRTALAAVALLPALPLAARAADPPPLQAAALPPPPSGNCPDCIGEVNSTLNACPLNAPSCVSTLNDDEEHFAAPWQYEGDSAAAVARLIEVATGGAYEPGLLDSPFGISRGDAAAFITGGVAAALQGRAPPERPTRRRAAAAEPFDGVLVDRHTSEAGAEYVLISFGTGAGGQQAPSDPAELMDAEFLFLPGDSIVNVRACSRAQPAGGLSSGRLALSFEEGVVLDRNVARRRMEALRKALRWEITPVLTDFDPKYNPNAPVWFERLLNPFDERNSFTPSGEPYPEE